MRRKDWRGNPIKRGSTILYASHMGTRAWVTEAVIAEVHADHIIAIPVRTSEDPKVGDQTKRVKISAVDRITILP